MWCDHVIYVIVIYVMIFESLILIFRSIMAEFVYVWQQKLSLLFPPVCAGGGGGYLQEMSAGTMAKATTCGCATCG